MLAQRRLGNHGPSIFPLARGCMGMSAMYGPADDGESIATIHAALDRGVNLIDTGDFYGIGHNELLVGRALAGQRDRALISVKFGALRAPGGGWVGFDARPAAVKNSLAHTLTRLGVDFIDIYRPARLDPNVPIEETIGAIAEMVQAGYVRWIGLSEVRVETIRRAEAVHPIVDVQLEYSLISRSPEEKIFPFLRERGIAVTAYGVLSRGLLSGSVPTGGSDIRNRFPRFSPANLEQNRKLVDTLGRLAAARGVTPTQLAIAWALAKGDFIVPLIGARTRKQLDESLAAAKIDLTSDEVAEIERAIPQDAVAGTRYDEHGMKSLDSER